MIAEILKIFSVLFLFVFLLITVGLAMKKVLEHMETNPFAAELISRNLILAFIVLHLYFIHVKLAKGLILLSFIAHSTFLYLFNDYPYIKAKDYRFIISLIITIINHIYLGTTFQKSTMSGIQVFICYLIIWGTPMIVFFSLSANQDTVPIEINKRQASKFLGKIVEWTQSFSKSSNKDQAGKI